MRFRVRIFGEAWKIIWVDSDARTAWRARQLFWNRVEFSEELSRGLPKRIYRCGRFVVNQQRWEAGIDFRQAISQGWAIGSLLENFRSGLEHLVAIEKIEPKLLHGDLSPANLLLTQNANALWIDWETSLLESRPRRERRLFVKPSYLAPERAWGWIPTKKSEVFSLGAILFEVLTKTPLFAQDLEGFHAAALFRREDLDEKMEGLPEEFQSLIAQSLSPDLAFRTKNFSEFLHQFERALLKRKRFGAVAEQISGAS